VGGALAETTPVPPVQKPKPQPQPAPVQPRGKPGDAAKPKPKPGDAAKPKPGDPPKPAPDVAGAPVAPAGDLVIGAYLSLTGAQATFGMSTDEGIALAVDEQNRAGGVRGHKIVLRTLDTAGRSSGAADAVTRLVTREGAIAILGEVTSGTTLAGAAVAQQSGIPMITPAATNPAVTEVGDMISRACMLDDDQAAAMAAFARDRLKLSRVAVLYDQAQPYSTGLATSFAKAFSRLGGTITGVQRYTSGDQDLQTQLEAIRDAKAQAVFAPGFYTDVGGIAKQLRALGVTAPLLGTDGWDSPQLAQIAGAAIDGSYYAGHFAADDPRPIV
jgi:branched-chain amino acid transport system substrate-binding protein